MMDTKIVIDKKGRKITLTQQVDYCTVEAHSKEGVIGSFEFNEYDDGHSEYLMVTNMHLEKLDGYTRCGIGTEIVDWVKECSGLPVAFGSDDGLRSEDGSHLTGNGPAFAHAIQSRK